MKHVLTAGIVVAVLVLAGSRAGEAQKPSAGPGIQVREGVISVSPEVAQQIHASAGIDFPSIGANACADRMMDMPGAKVSDTLAVAWPPTIEQGLVGMAFVAVPDKVAVRLCNVTGKGIDPPALPFAVRLISGY